MILRALYDYYQQRKDQLPSPGKELKEIGFILVLSDEGEFIRFEDRRKEGNKSADQFLVRKSVGRSSAPVANYLYDNSAYVLGYSEKPNALKYYDVFKAKIEDAYNKAPDNKDLERLKNFYGQNVDEKLEKMQSDPLWPEIIKNLGKKFSFFSFRFETDREIVAAKDELIDIDMEQRVSSPADKICLITGDRDEIVEITTATMIPGSQAIAKLVAFQVNSGYDSYGKKKGGNAPIGKKAEFAYTTAMNHMLGKNSRNKFLLGNRTFIFWSSVNNDDTAALEEATADLLSLESFVETEKDPELVRKVFTSIYSGDIKASDDKFYILGLAPNSARIAVSYWAAIPLRDFAKNILCHFDDFDIVDIRLDKKPYMGLRSILSAVTLGGKSSEAIPNLAENVVKSIFQHLPYPAQLYNAAIRRIRAEQKIGITRAAIIKAYLNRLNNNNKITKMLDKTNENPGYLCGRLFATIEKIQSEANGKASVKEGYMNSASTVPATVFPTLLNLSNHHLEKLSVAGKIYFRNLEMEIFNKFDGSGFPTQLSLLEQGNFFMGYFHQLSDFYTSKKDNAENK
jgi:CRISPR-associated protein Csd1